MHIFHIPHALHLFSIVFLGNKFGKPQGKFQKPQGKFQKPQQGKFQGKFQKPGAGGPGKFGKPSDGNSKPANAAAAATAAAAEKVDWNKFKQEKKELRQKRKAARTGFDKIQEAKQLYEKLKWYALQPVVNSCCSHRVTDIFVYISVNQRRTRQTFAVNFIKCSKTQKLIRRWLWHMIPHESSNVC